MHSPEQMTADPTSAVAGTHWTWRPAGLPGVTVRPFDLAEDLEMLHRWVTHPRSRYWGLGGATVDDVEREYAALSANPRHDVWIGLLDGVPTFLTETYDATHHELAGHFEVRPGDLGMHVLVAPPSGPPRSGLTDLVMAAVMRFCWSRPGTRRIVVEPDVGNTAIHAKNASAGFAIEAVAALSDKRALLSTCRPEDFEASRLGGLGVGHEAPETVDLGHQHLAPERMEQAHRLLVAKALAEFSHERIIDPEEVGPAEGRYRSFRLPTAAGTVYEFAARRLHLDHWLIDAGSLCRTDASGHRQPVDASELALDLRDRLGIPDELLPTYLEEIAATLAARCRTLDPGRPSVRDLLDADLAAVEAAMSEGHPCFVATNGRIGFSTHDAAAYAPECSPGSRPLWVAARRTSTHLARVPDLTDDDVWGVVLVPGQRDRLDEILLSRGLDPADYVYLPVHPWQWEHHLTVTFAPDVARGDLVPLAHDPHRHRPQQSIRTWLDVDDLARPYVKTALAIQNMGFRRGLSPAYMRVTPAINAWVADVVRTDPELVSRRFDVLRELASVGYTGDVYHRIGDRNPYTKMIAALWRESPVPRIRAGERLVTMASLLHRDPAGDALVTAMIARSGLTPTQWLRAYLEAVLRPVTHLLAHHRLAFMPHGENLILVLDDCAVTGAFLKDIGEEAALLDRHRPLPPDVERIRMDVTDEVAALAILTDLVDGFLRFLAAILDEDEILPQDDFWEEVAGCLLRYADEHPGALDGLDLFADRFARSCLNRLQLRNTSAMVDLTDQAGSLIFAGNLENPIAAAARRMCAAPTA
jgi:siderophore synthetase component